VKNGAIASPVAVMAVLLQLLLLVVVVVVVVIVVVVVVVRGGGERGAERAECYKEEMDILHAYVVKQ
jgi:hypothetical protein